ncbi:histidine kinase [Aestuariibaculum sp. YM273]|uniref:sensor histidine kinase n=1 Tax=Aestuariibaculum sp. YM273 TaxID=3070659 RepID=UPI0027DB8D41|nr:histidine kinase [Aestuariibaculum sp. YM273]WMI64310.1 histidine kinase [Aestuariibaculum sp. YM273]
MDRLLQCFFFIHFVGVIFGQQPAKIHLTEKDGLPDIEFYNILEDSKKFIWLAADNGLYRYDGKSYQHFTNSEQRGNAVFGVFEDHLGRVWCNNISGQFFYVSGNTMYHFIDLSKELKGQITEFLVTNSELIIITRHNILSVNLKSKMLKKALNKKVEIGNLSKNKTGYIYTEDDKIVKADFQFKNKKSISVGVFSNDKAQLGISRKINVIEKDSLVLYFFSQFKKNKFYKIDAVTGKDYQITLPDQLVSRTILNVFFKADQIWFSTDCGLYVCQLKEDKLRLIHTLFSSIYITKVIKDSFNNFWIITKGDGIYIYPNINVLEYDLLDASKNLSQIEKINDSTLLFGTSKGHFGSLNINNGQVKIIDKSSAYRVSKIFKKQQSDTIIVSKEDKTQIYNLSNKTLTTINNKLNGAKGIAYGNAKYSVSTYRSLEFFNQAFNKVDVIMSQRSYGNHFSRSNNAFYNASVDGLFYIDTTNDTKEIKANKTSIYVKTITETEDGNIWVSTFKNGVYCVKNDSVIAHVTKEKGLFSNRITQIKGDKNSLWIATEKGIQFYDFSFKTFKNLTVREDIPSYRITDIETIGNHVFFASTQGLFSINKTTSFKTNVTPKIYFTNVQVNSKNQKLLSQYQLAHNENSVKIVFNVNGFKSNENTKYNYRLLGQSKNWYTTDDYVNSVVYNSLPSGNYTFEVKLANNKGNVKTINFAIAKPFWNTWWFYTFIALIITGLLYALYIIKINKLKRRQNAQLQNEMINRQLVLSQLENLRSQMNPHFIFNALNSIQEYIVLNEKDLASSFLIKFSRLIRIYLDHSRQDEVSLSQEINALKIYLELEKNRFEDALNYAITISENLNANKIKVPSLFIQPYVENALKHGLLHKKDNRKLEIIFKLNDAKTKCLCIIKDNGIGVEASMRLNQNRNPQHRSFATSANQKRVKLINHNRTNKIEVIINSSSYTKDSGTIIIISIPL